jgi:BirA family biotin operon repressor/biotin-[acetyl-CoA-carboxylase] ligase
MSAPTFPPLLHGQATVDDPIAVAIQMARDGCDGGTVVYNLGGNDLRAAMIFAPDVVLADALAMLPVCGVGFQNALGAIAPPEIAVQLQWDGAVRLNGGLCGGLSVLAATDDPEQIPDWLIVGLQIPLWSATDNPGETPDVTTLYAEGCSDVDPVDLLEGWSRHTLVWINRWSDEGLVAIHAEYQGLMHRLDGELGVDENFGLLRKVDGTTTLTPLTALLE